MRIEGRATPEICDVLEIQPRTLYNWFSDPLVKGELARQLERINEIFAEKLAETAVRGLTALADVAATPVHEPLDWKTKLEAVRLIVDRTVPPEVFPDPELPDDPAKAFMIKAIRELNWDQLEQLGQGASDKLARIEGQRDVNRSGRNGT
jgi:hypothetical protein